MIHLGIVASAHKFAGSANPTIALNGVNFRTSFVSGTTVQSYGNVLFGTAATGRIVCIMVTSGFQAIDVNAIRTHMDVTIDGKTARFLVGHNQFLGRAIFAVQLDSGTSGTVVVRIANGSGYLFGSKQQITSFSVYDGSIDSIATAEDSSKTSSFNITQAFSLTPATESGGAIAYGVSAAGVNSFPSYSFTNATELADFQAGTGSDHAVGLAKLENTSTSETISNTCSDSFTNRPGAIAVSFLVSQAQPKAIATYIGQDDFTTNNTASGTHTRTFDFTTTIDTEATYVAVVHGQSSGGDFHDINSVTIGGSSATSVVKSGGASSYTGQLARYTCSMWSVTGLSSGSSIQVAGVFDNGVGGDVFRSACQLYKVTGGTVSVIDTDESGATSVTSDTVTLDRSATEVVIIGALANSTDATLSTTNGLVEDSDFVTESFLNVLSGRASGSSNTGTGLSFSVSNPNLMQATRIIGATFGVS